jgi:hypothetical protein
MEPNKVEFLVRQHIRCQLTNVLDGGIDENLPPLPRMCDKPRNMVARTHDKPPRVNVDGSSSRLPASIARVNDDAAGLSPSHHRLGEFTVGRDVDCYPVALNPVPCGGESKQGGGETDSGAFETVAILRAASQDDIFINQRNGIGYWSRGMTRARRQVHRERHLVKGPPGTCGQAVSERSLD